MALDWDIVDENMDDISEWGDLDTGTGESSQATYDGRSCMKLDANGVNNDAMRNLITGLLGTSFTCEIAFNVSTFPDTDYGFFYLELRDNSTPYDYQVKFHKDYIRLYISTAPTFIFADCNIQLGTWNTLRVVVINKYISIWLNGLLLLHDVLNGLTAVGWTKNTYILCARGCPEGQIITYIDSFKLDSSAEHIATSPLNIANEKIAIRYRQDTSDSEYLNGREALRTYGPTRYGENEQILSVPLVGISDPNASKTRMYEGVAVKSLMKLPVV